MVGMNAKQRIDDICAISGLSEDIVRRVMSAERESIIRSLKRGERSALLGRAVIRPRITAVFDKQVITDANGNKKVIHPVSEDGIPITRQAIRLKVEAAPSLVSLLEKEANFECVGEDEFEGLDIRTAQIEDLI